MENRKTYQHIISSIARSPIAALVLILGIVFWVNYHPGSYLSGWDNLHPEFNFAANVRRSFFSSWQEYKGTGVVEGQGLTADLARQLVLWAMSLVIPIDALRWFFHFSMLLCGSIGIYVLMTRYMLSAYSWSIRRSAGMAAAMFYLFNLATLQMFYVPFEPFSSHFGMVPWLFWGMLEFQRTGTRRSLWLFILVSIFSIPQGAVITVFLVYLIILSFVCAAVSVHTGQWKRSVVILFLTIAINGYWLFPTISFGLHKSDENVSALNNIMSTETILLKNKKYGTVDNTMILKGYLFDNIDMDPDGATSPQMAPWVTHLDRPGVVWVGYILFLLGVLGIIVSVVYRVSRGLYFVLPLIFSFTMLSNDAPVFSSVAALLYRLPLFSQIFRFPFTKFSLATGFFLALFYAIGCAAVLHAIHHRIGRWCVWCIYLIMPVIFCFPFFSGNLIYDQNRVIIPNEYFAVYEFFRGQPKDERIANFPQYSFWEWMHYRWNYSGAGIVWFGIEQPILDRNWDSWGKENENYYHEVSYAIYSNNPVLFSRVLEKYQVRWILIDSDLISFSSAKDSYIEQLESMVKHDANFHLAENFGHISIYRVDGYVHPEKYVSVSDNPVIIEPSYAWNNYDRAYMDYRTYIALSEDAQGIASGSMKRVFYPFRSLFTGRRESERAFVIEEHAQYYSLVSAIPQDYAGATLIIPPLLPDEGIIVDENNPDQHRDIAPQVFLNGTFHPRVPDGESSATTGHQQVKLDANTAGHLEIRIPKSGRMISDGDLQMEECSYDTTHQSTVRYITEKSEKMVHFSTQNAIDCMGAYLSQVSHRRGYMIELTSRHIQGLPLAFWIDNVTLRRKDMEVYLGRDTDVHKEYYVQPPMDSFGMDYTLHFNNVSIGKEKSINDLGQIYINPIPYRFLTSMRLVDDAPSVVSGGNTQLVAVSHPNPGWYQITLQSADGAPSPATLVLSQSFDDGWKAYTISCKLSVVSCMFRTVLPFVFFEENKNHVLVNNWSNGWILNTEPTTYNVQPTTIVLVFLPQYLSYSGYSLLVSSLFFPFLLRRRRNV